VIIVVKIHFFILKEHFVNFNATKGVFLGVNASKREVVFWLLSDMLKALTELS